MKLIVTGAGRCGTWWLTDALRSCGIDARHEEAFNHETYRLDGWTCEVSWLAAPYLLALPDTYVVHLVRHPLRQIASRAAWGSFEERRQVKRYDPRPKGRWAIRICPQIADGRTPVERAAIHWECWNRMVADAEPDERLRIEDVDADAVHRLARIVDPDAPAPDLTGARRNRTDVTPPRLGWADVEHVDGLRALAESYGYR